MKKLSLQVYAVLLIGLVSFSSCLKDDDNGDYNNMPSAGLMFFVNSYPDSEALLYRLDGNIVANPLSGAPMKLDYQMFSGAQWLYPGKRYLTVTGYNANEQVLIDTAINIKTGQGYSSFIYGDKEEPLFAMTEDNPIDKKAGESGIRFLNLANGIGPVNLYIEGQEEPLYTERPIETGASTVEHEDFQPQKDGVYTFIVTDAEGNELARREYKNEDNGNGLLSSYYTIMLVGNANDEINPLYIGVVDHR